MRLPAIIVSLESARYRVCLSNSTRGKCSLNLRELCVQLVLAGLVHRMQHRNQTISR